MKTYILYIERGESPTYAADCLDSCKQFNCDAELFEGISGKQNRELSRQTGLHIRTTDYASEYCGTVGHFKIWEKIAASDEVGVVLEHDCVAVADYSNLTVGDGEILCLGPRLLDRSSYVFPTQYANDIDYIDTEFFKGAHAYAITPATARMMLDYLDKIKLIEMPIDGLLGLKNKFHMKLKVVDPAFVISEIGNHRRSFNFNTPDTTNYRYYPKFLEGVADQDLLTPTTEYEFTLDMFTQHIPHWLETFKLANIDTDGPIQILEVGAYEGRSTCWMSDNILLDLDSRITVIDTFEDWIEHPGAPKDRLLQCYSKNIALTKNGEKIGTYQTDSRVGLPSLLKAEKKFDFIYIDGNHSTDVVISDALAAFHLLKDNGVIIFDDYEWFDHTGEQPVKNALNIIDKLLPLKPILTDYQRSYMKNLAP
jgi:predicted O-methyltransferase YrrM/GR25 family glycosyltransferase involved in LPS biosynthesis